MRRNDQDDAPRAAPAGAGDPDAGDPDAPLGSYWRAKHAVAQLLRDAARALGTGAAGASGAPGPSAVGALLDELKARLAEDRFQLVVLGQFKRGKSSLMNAILGRPLLPTGIVPVTTAVTAVRHGARGRALVRRADRALVEEVPLAALPEFVTEAGNPGNRKQVLSVTVEAPAAFLRRGLCFVDTPGVGSALDQNTAATLAFLPEADAAIFVTSADGPLSGAELDLLDQVHGHVQRLFFVLNKIDQVPDEQRAELVSYTSGLLARHLGVEAVRLFPLSATQALAAEPGSRQALASGLPALEAALATLLGDDRQTVFLVSVLDHAIAAFAEARLELARRVDERLPAPGEAGAEHGQGAGLPPPFDVEALLDRAAAWREALLRRQPLPEDSAAVAGREPGAGGDVSAAASPAARSRRVPHADAGTCAVCAAASVAVFDFLCRQQYAIGADPHARRRFVASHGLCPPHTWHLERLSSPQGLCEGYPALLERTAERLRGLASLPAAAAAERLGSLVADSSGCAACLAQRRAAAAAAADLALDLARRSGPAPFAGARWLCLAHLRLLLTGATPEAAAHLLRAHARQLGNLAESMRESALKMDARRRALLSEEEMRAPRQALVLLVGERYLFRTEGEE